MKVNTEIRALDNWCVVIRQSWAGAGTAKSLYRGRRSTPPGHSRLKVTEQLPQPWYPLDVLCPDFRINAKLQEALRNGTMPAMQEDVNLKWQGVGLVEQR
ncbi:MAG: hypothetical protein ACFFCO_11065 [Promethearchaeota archaeon]